MTKTSKLMLGILGAAAAGVVVGLLIAPEKGSDTRKKIGKKAKDWRDQMTDMLHLGKSYVDELAGTVADEATGLKRDAEKRYNRVKEELS